MHQSSPHIMEDDSEDDQVLLERMNYKETKDASSIPKTPARPSKGPDRVEMEVFTLPHVFRAIPRGMHGVRTDSARTSSDSRVTNLAQIPAEWVLGHPSCPCGVRV